MRIFGNSQIVLRAAVLALLLFTILAHSERTSSSTLRTAVSFGQPQDYSTGRLPDVVAVGDFNHDKKQDMAVGNGAANDVSIFLGNGDGTFQPAMNFAAGNSPSAIAVGDFNHDGNFDLAVGDGGGSTVSILLGNGDGPFNRR